MPGFVARGSSSGAGGGTIASVCGGQADAPGRPGLLHLVVLDAAGADGGWEAGGGGGVARPICLTPPALSPALQEDTWQDKGTHLVKKKLDLYDHLAMAVGPRPDTVTSDNLRSSRTEADVRRFNPGSPVDLETGAPITPVIPQSTGRSLTPEQVYDVSATNRPSPLTHILTQPLTCICCAVERTYSTSSTSRVTLVWSRHWRYQNDRHCLSQGNPATLPRPRVHQAQACLLVPQVSA
jgi:hypothetical protein